MLLPCLMQDSALPGGACTVVLNTNHVIWFCPHPEDPGKTLVRLTHQEVLCILAPFADVLEEINNARDDS